LGGYEIDSKTILFACSWINKLLCLYEFEYERSTYLVVGLIKQINHKFRDTKIQSLVKHVIELAQIQLCQLCMFA